VDVGFACVAEGSKLERGRSVGPHTSCFLFCEFQWSPYKTVSIGSFHGFPKAIKDPTGFVNGSLAGPAEVYPTEDTNSRSLVDEMGGDCVDVVGW
jgi:hypothetical protein